MARLVSRATIEPPLSRASHEVLDGVGADAEALEDHRDAGRIDLDLLGRDLADRLAQRRPRGRSTSRSAAPRRGASRAGRRSRGTGWPASARACRPGSTWPARTSCSASTVSGTASGPSWKVVMSVIVCTPAFSITIPRSTSASRDVVAREVVAAEAQRRLDEVAAARRAAAAAAIHAGRRCGRGRAARRAGPPCSSRGALDRAAELVARRARRACAPRRRRWPAGGSWATS